MTTREYGDRVMYSNVTPRVEEDSGKLRLNAKTWLEQTGSKLRITFDRTGPYFDGEEQDRDVYSVELCRGGRVYQFQFGQSIVCSKPNIDRRQPSAASILLCLETHSPSTFEDFCAEYGYDTDSRNAEKIWRACADQYLALSAMYSPDELEALGRLED